MSPIASDAADYANLVAKERVFSVSVPECVLHDR